MSLQKGIITPAQKDQDEMFIGWAKAPAVDRRFLLGALPFGLLAGGGASALIASELDDPGPGAWLTNATHKVTGALVAAPYPMIRVPAPSAPFGMRTVLIVTQGKCTSALKLDEQNAMPVEAAGALIQRKDRQMLEVPPFLEDWLNPAAITIEPGLVAPAPQSLGEATLSGMIMDSKCFFGVMRPGRGKTHKACASLCIRGGIPASFWAQTRDGRELVLLLTDETGAAINVEEIIPFVADPVEAIGEIVRVGDLLQYRLNTSKLQRL